MRDLRSLKSELLAGQAEIPEPQRPNSEFSRARALRRMGPYKLFGFLSSLGSVPPNWFSSILPDIHTPSGELQANAVKASLLGYWGIRTQGWLEVAWTGYTSISPMMKASSAHASRAGHSASTARHSSTRRHSRPPTASLRRPKPRWRERGVWSRPAIELGTLAAAVAARLLC